MISATVAANETAVARQISSVHVEGIMHSCFFQVLLLWGKHV